MFKSLSPGTIGVNTTLTEGLAYAAAGGFQGLDVGIGGVAALVEEKGAGHVVGLFEEVGLKIGAWGLPVAWKGPEDAYRKDLEALPALAEAGAAVGAFRVAIWVSPASGERRFRENFRWHVSRFRPICEILKDHGCSLGLEFIGPRTLRVEEGFGFIHTMDGMLGLCETIGTGNVGLLLDCWHWYTGLGTLSDLRALRSRRCGTRPRERCPGGRGRGRADRQPTGASRRDGGDRPGGVLEGFEGDRVRGSGDTGAVQPAGAGTARRGGGPGDGRGPGCGLAGGRSGLN